MKGVRFSVLMLLLASIAATFILATVFCSRPEPAFAVGDKLAMPGGKGKPWVVVSVNPAVEWNPGPVPWPRTTWQYGIRVDGSETVLLTLERMLLANDVLIVSP